MNFFSHSHGSLGAHEHRCWCGLKLAAGASPRRKYTLSDAAREQRRAAGRASWKAFVDRAYFQWLYEKHGRAGGVARAAAAKRRDDGVFITDEVYDVVTRGVVR